MSAGPGPAHPLIGQVVGGVRLMRSVASGAVGNLLAGLDTASGEPRVVKILSPSGAASSIERDEAARHFDLEASVLQRLQHPAIVRCFGAGVHGAWPYLLLELLPGCDLRRYTRPDRLLPVPEVARIGQRVAEALACAHAQGVVHRDLKPANVMVDWASGRVVLTDFGVARLQDAQATRTGVVLGSPAYMAPELLAGEGACPGTDLYALGMLLYELGSARLPFQATGMGDLLRQVAQATPQPLRSLRGEVSTSLSALVDSLLAKSAGLRPPDAASVARALAGENHA